MQIQGVDDAEMGLASEESPERQPLQNKPSASVAQQVMMGVTFCCACTVAVAGLYSSMSNPNSGPHHFPVVAKAKFGSLTQPEAALAETNLDVMGRGRRDRATGEVEKVFLLHDAQDWSVLEIAAGTFEVDKEHTALLTLDESQGENERERMTQTTGNRRLYSKMPLRPCYRTVDGTYGAMADIAAGHPTLASIATIGNSTLGEGLQILKLTNQNSANAKAPMFITSGLHAREWAPPEVVTRFAEHLVANYGLDADITWILDNVGIHLLLQSNPDSRRVADLNTLNAEGALNDQPRKNRNNNGCTQPSPDFGTDLNRNFNFKWGRDDGSSGKPCNIIYRGPSAASEAETLAITRHSQSIFPVGQRRANPESNNVIDDAYDESSVGLFVDVHAAGKDVIFPWGFKDEAVGNLDGYKAISHKISSLNGYAPSGSGYSFLGKTSGDTLDYHHGALGVPSILFELGESWYETCNAFETTVFPDNLKALIYSAKLAPAPFRLSKGPDVLDLAISGSINDAVTITARASDNEMTELADYPAVGTGRQNIAGVAMYIDGVIHDPTPPTPFSMDPSDGQFNSRTEEVTYTLDTSNMAPGRHTVCLEAIDDEGYKGPKTCKFFDVANRCISLGKVDCEQNTSCRWKINKEKCVDLCQGVAKERNCDEGLCEWGLVDGGMKCYRKPW